MRWFILAALCGALVGCGDSPQPKAAKSSTPKTSAPAAKTAAKPATPRKPAVTASANAFSDLTSAFAALKQSCAAFEKANRDRNAAAIQQGVHEIMQTSAWISQQGAAAIKPVVDEMNRSSESGEYRLALARSLADIGPEATAALQRATKSDHPMIRKKAIESLGRMRPVQGSTVDLLVGLLSDKDEQAAELAITALGKIGAEAKDAGPKLQAILNSDAPEGMRDRAHRALKAVNPRRTFQD